LRCDVRQGAWQEERIGGPGRPRIPGGVCVWVSLGPEGQMLTSISPHVGSPVTDVNEWMMSIENFADCAGANKGTEPGCLVPGRLGGGLLVFGLRDAIWIRYVAVGASRLRRDVR
jgi:hypothetical protein